MSRREGKEKQNDINASYELNIGITVDVGQREQRKRKVTESSEEGRSCELRTE